MNCPIHNNLKLSLVKNISMHHKDGIIEDIPLFKCKKCNKYFVSTEVLEDCAIRKLRNGIEVKNFYTDYMKSKKEIDKYKGFHVIKTNNDKCWYTTEIIAGQDTININVHGKGYGNTCPDCNVKLIGLSIEYKKNNKSKCYIGRKCPKCGKNFLHANIYINNPELFYVVNIPYANSIINEYENNRLMHERKVKIQKEERKNKLEKITPKISVQKKDQLIQGNNMYGTHKLQLNLGEKLYLMCELRDLDSNMLTKVHITSAYVPRTINDDKIEPVGSELGQLCIKSVANDIEIIRFNNKNYNIDRYVRHDVSYVEKFKDKSFKNIAFNNEVYPLEPKQIDKKIVCVYYKLNNSCIRDRHNIDNVTMKVTNIRDNHMIDVNVFQCKTCGKYFINYDQLKEYIERKMVPAFKYSIIKGSFDTLNEISELMLYGYTVKEGALTERERHGILAWILNGNLMSKNQIIRNIQYKIDYNGKKKSNAKAKVKWEDDMAFVANYNLNTQSKIKGTLVWR